MIKLRAILFFVLATLACAPPVFSQNDISDQMNAIKLDEKYISEEKIWDNENIAYDKALDDLTVTCNDIRAESDLPPLRKTDLQVYIKKLQYEEDSQYCVLVYIPIEDVKKIKPRPSGVPINTVPPAVTPSIQQPQAQTQTQTQPVFTTPTTATPIINSDSASMSSNGAKLLAILTNLNTWTEAKGLLIQFKDMGEITAQGACRSYAEVPEDSYCILLNEHQGIIAVLSPKNTNKVINYKNNSQPDSASNYPNTKVFVWYK